MKLLASIPFSVKCIVVLGICQHFAKGAEAKASNHRSSRPPSEAALGEPLNETEWMSRISGNTGLRHCVDSQDANLLNVRSLTSPCRYEEDKLGDFEIDGVPDHSFRVNSVHPVAVGNSQFAVVSTTWEAGGSGSWGYLEIYRRIDTTRVIPVARLSNASSPAVSESGRITVEGSMSVDQDAHCCPSFLVTSGFQVSQAKIFLSSRSVALNPQGSVATSGADSAKLESASQEITAILLDRKTSGTEKAKGLRVKQDTLGRELFTTVMRNIPIYDDKEKRFKTYDTWLRELGGAPTRNTALERDPVGASMSLFFDPSMKNVAEKMGLEMPGSK